LIFTEFMEMVDTLIPRSQEPCCTDATAPTPAENGLPIYDRADALSRIADDEELLATLIDMFVADAPKYLAEIDTALQAADWPLLRRAVHTLKGVLATFSARRGAACARALETAIQAADVAECSRLAAQARIEVEAFLQAIKQE
jgi:HPt (histidine-containing phosphotransfer) domain-containing protein